MQHAHGSMRSTHSAWALFALFALFVSPEACLSATASSYHPATFYHPTAAHARHPVKVTQRHDVECDNAASCRCLGDGMPQSPQEQSQDEFFLAVASAQVRCTFTLPLPAPTTFVNVLSATPGASAAQPF